MVFQGDLSKALSGIHCPELLAYRTLTPWAFSRATAGDHIDSSTTSFEAMKLTESVKADQKARNCPFFLYLPMILKRWSISDFVGLP